MVDIVHLIVFYAFLGGSIKYIDQAYDEKAFSIRSAKVLAVLAGVVMGYLMAQDSPFSTAFFAAMLISLVIARKIDNFAFAIGTVLAVVSFLALYPTSHVTFLLAPIAVFLVAGFVDEVADGLGGNAFVATKLIERYRSYFSHRVPGLSAHPANTEWAGACPFCAGSFTVNGATGYWLCDDCFRSGEVYSMEFQLHGDRDPERWEACRLAADALMNGQAHEGTINVRWTSEAKHP